jgi:hypothetical protein
MLFIPLHPSLHHQQPHHRSLSPLLSSVDFVMSSARRLHQSQIKCHFGVARVALDNATATTKCLLPYERDGRSWCIRRQHRCVEPEGFETKYCTCRRPSYGLRPLWPVGRVRPWPDAAPQLVERRRICARDRRWSLNSSATSSTISLIPRCSFSGSCAISRETSCPFLGWMKIFVGPIQHSQVRDQTPHAHCFPPKTIQPNLVNPMFGAAVDHSATCGLRPS